VWWEVVLRQLVARGFERRSATALSDKGDGSSSCNNNNNSFGRLSSRRALMSAICSTTSARVSGVGTIELCWEPRSWESRGEIRESVERIFVAISTEEGKEIAKKKAALKTASRT
jgi:hypothetical protein